MIVSALSSPRSMPAPYSFASWPGSRRSYQIKGSKAALHLLSGFAARVAPDAQRASGLGAQCCKEVTASARLAQPHQHVDPNDLVAFRHIGHLQEQLRIRDVHQFVVALDVEVVMCADIGVEIGLGAVDADL